MDRGALDGGARAREPRYRPRELFARGIQERLVVQPGVAPGGPRAWILMERNDGLLAITERGALGLVGVYAEAE